MNKKIISGILLIILIAILVFLYGTRAPSAPTQSIDSVINNTASSTGQNYKISNASSVEFRIDEILREKPFTAVGVSNEIAGNISVNGNSITIDTLAINAKTFKTDDSRRDGAITRFILKSEDPANEFIYFKTSNIETKKINNSSEFILNVSGNLTISGITKPTTFDVKINISDSQITGTASTTIKRSDFDLKIPSLPFIASVNDEFTIVTKIVADRIR